MRGIKSGGGEKRFYRRLIRKADDRFDAHLARLKKEREVIMAVNVDDRIKKLSPAQRKKVEARAAELIAEEMTLRELRHARKLTQVRVAKKLGITQDSVSRLEKRSDLLLSTLRKNGRGDGWKPVAGGQVPRPRSGCAVRHRRGWPARPKSLN